KPTTRQSGSGQPLGLSSSTKPSAMATEAISSRDRGRSSHASADRNRSTESLEPTKLYQKYPGISRPRDWASRAMTAALVLGRSIERSKKYCHVNDAAA